MQESRMELVSSPATRTQEVAAQIVELVISNLPGVQGKLLTPMLNNYFTQLSTVLTDDKAIHLCRTIQGFVDYIEYGTGQIGPCNND